jgi:hypothetical protein
VADLITEEWLRSVGFKWHQFDRQPDKQWLLWLGDATGNGEMFTDLEDLGIELAPVTSNTDLWHCWLRSDAAHRYSRFLHIRHLKTQDELIALIEAVAGQAFDPINNINGSMFRPEIAARLHRKEEERQQRLDVKMLRPNWRDIEKDDSRGRALPEHLQAAEDARVKEK